MNFTWSCFSAVRYTQYNCSAKSNQLVLEVVTVCCENRLTDLGKVILLCYLIINNPVHISTTHEQYRYFYYHFPTTCFDRFIRTSSGRGYVNEKNSSCVFHIDTITSRRIRLVKLFKIHLYDSMDFSGKLYWIFCVYCSFIGNNSSVHCEGKASSVAYFSIYVLVSCTVW